MVRIDGLENHRVIDFLKHSLNCGFPNLDIEVPEGNFEPQRTHNPVMYKVWASREPQGQPKTLYFTALRGVRRRTPLHGSKLTPVGRSYTH